MRAWLLLPVVLALIVSGCRSPEPRQANDRVAVQAPGVSVNVGEDGGARIKAPGVNIETSQYRQSRSATSAAAAPASPALLSAPANPDAGVQYPSLHPAGNIAPSNSIPPATATQGAP